MDAQHFFRDHCEMTVIYRYLDMLAERTVMLEQLRIENKRLRAQLAQGSPMSLEQLVAFLPVIYRNFWNSVSPNDLALLSGNLKIPEIPSPCPEPSAEVIATMRQRLSAMPVPGKLRLAMPITCRSSI